MKAGFQVDGVRRLRSALKGMGDDLTDFKDVNRQVASYVGAVAAGNAPRRSGMLAASWRPSGTVTRAAVRFGGATVPYANAVHWGTGPRPGRRGPHNIARNPFAVNAAHSTETVWGPWYMDFIDHVLKKEDLE